MRVHDRIMVMVMVIRIRVRVWVSVRAHDLVRNRVGDMA